MDINTERNKREQGNKTKSQHPKEIGWFGGSPLTPLWQWRQTLQWTQGLWRQRHATVDTVDLTYELHLSYELSPLWLLKSLQFFTSLSKSMSTRENTLPLIGSPESSPTRRQNSLATSSSFFGEYHIFRSYVLETWRWSKDHTHGLTALCATHMEPLPAPKEGYSWRETIGWPGRENTLWDRIHCTTQSWLWLTDTLSNGRQDMQAFWLKQQLSRQSLKGPFVSGRQYNS